MIKTTIKNGTGIKAKEHKGIVGAIAEAREALASRIEVEQAVEIRIIYTPNLKRSKHRGLRGRVITVRKE